MPKGLRDGSRADADFPVLTSRKYGVATVWLVATLGAKSALKKVSRKAILDVDVQKACETIVTPEAPMALRLQSNLLYVQPNQMRNRECEAYTLAGMASRASTRSSAATSSRMLKRPRATCAQC